MLRSSGDALQLNAFRSTYGLTPNSVKTIAASMIAYSIAFKSTSEEQPVHGLSMAISIGLFEDVSRLP